MIISMQLDSEICIRLKRQKETYFFKCTQFQLIDSIKRRLAGFFKGIEATDIRLYLGSKLLDEKSNVHDQGIINNALIHFKLKKGNTGQWEQISQLGV